MSNKHRKNVPLLPAHVQQIAFLSLPKRNNNKPDFQPQPLKPVKIIINKLTTNKINENETPKNDQPKNKLKKTWPLAKQNVRKMNRWTVFPLFALLIWFKSSSSESWGVDRMCRTKCPPPPPNTGWQFTQAVLNDAINM